MHILKASVLVLAALLAASPAFACGKERWNIKVGADLTVPGPVSYPQSTTIAELVAIPAPSAIRAFKAPSNKKDILFYQNKRFEPTETTVFSLDATMTVIKHEVDGDYHIVLRDGANTMIVESPDPACAQGSVLLPQITEVRAAIEQKFGGPIVGRKGNLAIPVHVEGMGFFDFCHGQEGRAPNCIELHPILKIEFR